MNLPGAAYDHALFAGTQEDCVCILGTQLGCVLDQVFPLENSNDQDRSVIGRR